MGRYSDEDLSLDYEATCGFAASDQALMRDSVEDILSDLGFPAEDLLRLDLRFFAADSPGARPFALIGFSPDGGAKISYQR